MKLTVAICTWNRAGLLESTLAEMTKIRPPRSDWEVLVIDNNCVDRTKEVVTSFLQKLPIKYLFEKQQGLSHARNCAVACASGDYVIWTDDDVLSMKIGLSHTKVHLIDSGQVRFSEVRSIRGSMVTRPNG